jgi:hypothetical protein
MRQFRGCSWLLPLAAAALLSSGPAQAGVILSVSPVTITAGTVGAFFDVSIQNTGSGEQNIAAFSLGLSVADPHITFTGGNTSTTLTYLFNGDSLDVIGGLAYTTVPPPNGQTLEASDLSNSSSGNTMAAGTTWGLGRIFFDVAANTGAGAIAVTLIPDCLDANSCTSLSDSAFNDVPFGVVNGNITVTAGSESGVPEPSTLLLVLLALAAIGAGVWRKGRCRDRMKGCPTGGDVAQAL